MFLFIYLAIQSFVQMNFHIELIDQTPTGFTVKGKVYTTISALAISYLAMDQQFNFQVNFFPEITIYNSTQPAAFVCFL